MMYFICFVMFFECFARFFLAGICAAEGKQFLWHLMDAILKGIFAAYLTSILF